MKKKFLIFIIVIAIILIPIKNNLKNGTITYTSLFYRFITSNEKETKNEFQLFPKNLKELEEKNGTEVLNKIVIYDTINPTAIKDNYFKLGETDNIDVFKEISDIISRAKIIDDKQISVDTYNYILEIIDDETKMVNVWVLNKKIHLIQTKNDNGDYYYYDININDQARLFTLINSAIYDLDKPCEFTQTFYVIKVYEKEKRLKIKQFNDENEYIINMPQTSFKFKDKKNYEFTFKITKKIDITHNVNLFLNSEIIDIKETDKLGLEQVQETCRY